MCFAVAQNLIYNKNLEVILLQEPSERVQSYEEIVLWLKLGWIKLAKKNIAQTGLRITYNRTYDNYQ